MQIERRGGRLIVLTRLCSLIVVLATSAFLLGACDSTGPSSQRSTVDVGFTTSYPASTSTSLRAKSDPDSLTLVGTNGTLTVTDIRLIVSGVELEGDADSADVEAGPTFLDLPLDTTEIEPVAASEVPPGTYTEFEFEVEDVDIDENDDDAQDLQDLRASIRQDFPNWPEGASMVVVGTFTPEEGTAQGFTAYFEAEIEVERALSPPLEVTGDGFSRRLTVELDPTAWFTRADGTVLNLAQFDYASTNQLVEFEAEFEDGVTEVEVDNPEDDD